ncbi:uncharacterized protein LOC112083935 [Eutrema salsugineum]|uniref:uncharacterized protein LOC112083935 n=1 Tax=Eutrema salsugineum TaxID=72664 RepID=UPI000CED376C|nr:uncharacterized protein LOC112083935 [Eutrema salsugineum]
MALPSNSVEEDVFSWVVDGKKCNGFSAAHTWSSLRPCQPTKSWFNSIWFKGAIPKHAFLMWIAQLNRLPTRIRLASWGMSVPTDCCLCSAVAENRDHLFLTCDYSSEIWRSIQSRLNLRHHFFLSWDELLSWMRTSTKSAPKILRKISAHAAIYCLWRQRNNVLHNLQSIPAASIFKEIDKLVRNIITTRRQRKYFGVMMPLWLK